MKALRDLVSAARIPEGCQPLAGGRSAAQPPGSQPIFRCTLKGCQRRRMHHASATLPGCIALFVLTGGVARGLAQPPADRCQASGLVAGRASLPTRRRPTA